MEPLVLTITGKGGIFRAANVAHVRHCFEPGAWDYWRAIIRPRNRMYGRSEATFETMEQASLWALKQVNALEAL